MMHQQENVQRSEQFMNFEKPENANSFPENYFLPGDIRGQIKEYLKEKCPHSFRDFLRFDVARERFLTSLAADLSEDKGPMIRFEVSQCGKNGEKQLKVGTENEYRYKAFHCNHRKLHVPCNERYFKGQGKEIYNHILNIMKSKNLKHLYDWTFTLPRYIRRAVSKFNPENKKAFELKSRRAVSWTIKESLGISKKTRGVNAGFWINTHEYSSGDPFKYSLHYHSLILPIIITTETGSIEKTKPYISHKLIKDNYKKNIDKVLLEFGLDPAEAYVVQLVTCKKTAQIKHKCLYNNRSLAADLVKKIKRIKYDFSEVLYVKFNKQDRIHIPEIISYQRLLGAFRKLLNNRISCRMSYGFSRTLSKYLDVLGLEKDDFEAVEWERVCYIEMHRFYKNEIDERGRIRQKLQVRIKEPGEEWKAVDPEDIYGETAFMNGRKLYKIKGESQNEKN